MKKNAVGDAGKVRIISGIFKGRKLLTPGGNTHPMGERERIALFNMISDYLPGARTLDAFAGSGVLGLETLSRGAESVVFIDSSRKAEGCIYSNMVLLGFCEFIEKSGEKRRVFYRSRLAPKDGQLGEVEVICQKASQFKSSDKFDVIFADPPYDSFDKKEVGELVKYLRDDGIFVLSHPLEIEPEFLGLTVLKSRKYAAAGISILHK